MHQKATTINAEELFDNFSNLSEFQNMEDGFEKYWDWPGEIGNGFMYMIKLRPGLMLGIGDYQLWEHLTVSFEMKSPLCILGFGLSRSVLSTPGNGRGKKDVFIFNSGESFISYLPEWQGIAEYPVRTPTRTVGIYMDPQLLNTFMEEQHDRIPTGMHDIVNGTNEKHYYHALTTTPMVNMAIHQVLNCPYRGPLKRLYLESKALELITHQLAQLVFAENYLQKPSVLRCDDVERIHYARDLLVKDIQNPPTIYKLSRMAGINEFKLKKGFRQLYDTSIHRYLVDLRFERARYLLDQGNMNVSEVAYSVGYSTPGHFYAAFKKRFGVPPGAYCRDVRKAINP